MFLIISDGKVVDTVKSKWGDDDIALENAIQKAYDLIDLWAGDSIIIDKKHEENYDSDETVTVSAKILGDVNQFVNITLKPAEDVRYEVLKYIVHNQDQMVHEKRLVKNSNDPQEIGKIVRKFLCNEIKENPYRNISYIRFPDLTPPDFTYGLPNGLMYYWKICSFREYDSYYMVTDNWTV